MDRPQQRAGGGSAAGAAGGGGDKGRELEAAVAAAGVGIGGLVQTGKATARDVVAQEAVSAGFRVWSC